MASAKSRVKRTSSETGAPRAGGAWVSWEPASGRELANAIAEVARQLRMAGIPPPKGQEFFGLDLDMPYEGEVLEVLGSQGIFRKYELALEIESGLGGRARWAAEVFGCRVVGVESTPAKVVVATELSRSRFAHSVSFVCGRRSALPVASGKFTHAWWLVAEECEEAPAIFGEVHRSLRDGGCFAVVLPNESEERVLRWAEGLKRAGFERVEVRSYGWDLPGERWRLAARRLTKYLHSRERELGAWRYWVGSTRATKPGFGLVLFARRRPALLGKRDPNG